MQPQTDLIDLLKPFKSDPPEVASVVLGDDDAMRVLGAFRSVEHKWKRPRAKLADGASLIARWKWLTSKWDIDIEGLAVAAGLGSETVEIKVDILVANRLVYPDGTVSRAAELALKAHLGAKLGVKSKATKETK